MKIRAFFAAGFFSMLATPAAFAQADWPSKPLRFVLPSTPGTTSELILRAVYDPVAKSLGTTTLFDSKPGVAGTLALTDVAKSAPDGYSYGIASLGSLGIAPTLYAKTVRFDPLKELTGIARLVGTSNVLVVSKGFAAKSLQEMIAYAKANPGKLNFAVIGGYGTSFHMTWVLIAQQTGINVVSVPFKGQPDAMQAILSGEVQVAMNAPASLLPQIRDGSVRALAVTTAKRAAVLPEVPTMVEGGLPGFDVSSWFGLVAPAGTPRAIIDRLSAETLKAMQNPDVLANLAKLGFDPQPMGAREFDPYYRAEIARWAQVVKASGFTPE
jgi:tripartite-type tricarboxylate transporter receptor subunit TctC